MYLRVVTNWRCWQRSFARVGECDGVMIVTGENNYHSVVCSKCGTGHAGRGLLPIEYFNRLVEEGYIRQLSRRPVEISDLSAFFIERLRRTPTELAGDLLENFEVFRDNAET